MQQGRVRRDGGTSVVVLRSPFFLLWLVLLPLHTAGAIQQMQSQCCEAWSRGLPLWRSLSLARRRVCASVCALFSAHAIPFSYTQSHSRTHTHTHTHTNIHIKTHRRTQRQVRTCAPANTSQTHTHQTHTHTHTHTHIDKSCLTSMIMSYINTYRWHLRRAVPPLLSSMRSGVRTARSLFLSHSFSHSSFLSPILSLFLCYSLFLSFAFSLSISHLLSLSLSLSIYLSLSLSLAHYVSLSLSLSLSFSLCLFLYLSLSLSHTNTQMYV